MKKTIFMLAILAFFSCSTDDEQTIQEEAKTNVETSVAKTNYRNDQWGSMQAYSANDRQAITIWVTYGQYKTIRREGVDGMHILKVPNKPVYAIDAGRINVGMPNIGNPLPYAGCNYFNDLATSNSTWAIQYRNGDISRSAAITHMIVDLQVESNITGASIFITICDDGEFIQNVIVHPDNGDFITEPGSSAMSGSWSSVA
ncbi:hypothetical protein [Kordia sp.]|uniref:hypothetical protein n=1 Tax=Kordia sp. TaxID=1965332 RepID=UPI003D2C0826